MSDVIVVGVDGSDTAMKAAEVAARLAAALGARLHVVTAYRDSGNETLVVGSDEFVFSTHDEALSVAQATAGQLVSMVPGSTSGSVLGKADEALIAEAKRLDAMLIVVGNRRMQGIARVLGSVANDVAHHAPCDVYIVKTT
jgi:nucleotide-binding universal stress UspA family protein